jgi:hypothetical protein
MTGRLQWASIKRQASSSKLDLKQDPWYRIIKEKVMETKTSWWYLKINDYPNYKPNDADLEHIAECIKQGYDNGQLIQEAEDEDQE